MKYAQLRKYDIANGEGIRTTLFVSGCRFNCEDCFNKEYQDFNYGNDFSSNTIETILEYLSDDNVSGFSILGGEPFLQNPLILLDLLNQVKNKFPQKTVWVWTGYLFENIPKEYHELLTYIDILVDGQFMKEKKDLTLKWCGSKNQRVIDIQKTLNTGIVEIYE